MPQSVQVILRRLDERAADPMFREELTVARELARDVVKPLSAKDIEFMMRWRFTQAEIEALMEEAGRVVR